MDGTIRIRSAAWFATAVVLSVFATVLVMQTLTAGAASDDEGSTFVPVTPCRLFDFRPEPFTIGPKNTPLGSGETNVYTQSVTGAIGDCVIPADATAISMNVTVLNGTAKSNLRIFPADVEIPNASSLNWLAGQSPTPNKVDVKLSAEGEFNLFNFNGTVDVFADVVGYYSTSNVVRDFEVVEGRVAVDLVLGETQGLTVMCPEGKLVTGGGASITSNDGLELYRTIPASNLAGWSGAVVWDADPGTGTLNVHAICASGVTVEN